MLLGVYLLRSGNWSRRTAQHHDNRATYCRIAILHELRTPLSNCRLYGQGREARLSGRTHRSVSVTGHFEARKQIRRAKSDHRHFGYVIYMKV